MSKREKNKILLIPGWLNTLKTYQIYEGIEIWEEMVDLEKKLEADILIGHSLGANFALLNWNKNRNAKLILVNPLLSRRNPLIWFWRFIKFQWREGGYENKIVVPGIKKYFRGIKGGLRLVGYDLLGILDKAPKDDIIVFRGKDDHFFCDEEMAGKIRSIGVQLVEIEGVGHNWHKKIDEEIRKLIR